MTLTFSQDATGGSRRYWTEVRLPAADGKIDLLLVSDGEALTGVQFGPARPPIPDSWVHDAGPTAEASAQLEAYAAGDLTRFDLTIRPAGTAFQQDVWAALTRIPYGATTTYGQVAQEVGRPAGSRAVGAAVGRNPIGVIIPCHRVIGADGSLTGFGGGLENKVALLRLEGITAF